MATPADVPPRFVVAAADHIVLVAAPEFLGRLRGALDGETRKRVDAELALNLTTLRADEIRARLLEKLEPIGLAH